MPAALSVRLDEEARRALSQVMSSGLSRSEAIRWSLVLAARSLRDRERLAAEAAALEADPTDRETLRETAELMEDLRAPW